MPKIIIKFVRRANMWCRTTSEEGKTKNQKQEWFHTKEECEKGLST